MELNSPIIKTKFVKHLMNYASPRNATYCKAFKRRWESPRDEANDRFKVLELTDSEDEGSLRRKQGSPKMIM